MKKILLVILCLFLMPQLVLAQEAPKAKKAKSAKIKIEQNGMFRKKDEAETGSMFRPKKPDKSEKAVLPAISDKDCQYLIAYQPKADGDAEYKPGVDAAGKPVLEAD